MEYRRTMRSVLAGVFILVLVSGIAWGQVTLTLQFTGMDPHVGEWFEVRVVNWTSGAEVTRLTVPEIPGSAFELDLELPGTGESYRIDFYVDHNGNGRYDPPPADHAWRLEVPEVSGNVTLDFSHNVAFTDIDWPPAIDGTIAAGEYRHVLSDTQTGIDINWQNDDRYLYVGLVSPGVGWVAIGFDPERKMQGANIIIGAVTDSELVIEDHFGASPTAHRKDGEDRIVQAAGTETDGVTTIEFILPLSGDASPDTYLTPGETVTTILAYHRSSDAFTARHSKRSTTQITLDGEDGS